MSCFIFITLCCKTNLKKNRSRERNAKNYSQTNLKSKYVSEKNLKKYSNTSLKSKCGSESIAQSYSKTGNLNLTKTLESENLTENFESSTSSNNIYLYPYEVN